MMSEREGDVVLKRREALMRAERALHYPSLSDETAVLSFDECRELLRELKRLRRKHIADLTSRLRAALESK